MMFHFGFLWKPLGSWRRKLRGPCSSTTTGMINRQITIHPQFYLFLLFMISYTLLITVFHFYDIRLIIQAVPSKKCFIINF